MVGDVYIEQQQASDKNLPKPPTIQLPSLPPDSPPQLSTHHVDDDNSSWLRLWCRDRYGESVESLDSAGFPSPIYAKMDQHLERVTGI